MPPAAMMSAAAAMVAALDPAEVPLQSYRGPEAERWKRMRPPRRLSWLELIDCWMPEARATQSGAVPSGPLSRPVSAEPSKFVVSAWSKLSDQSSVCA